MGYEDIRSRQILNCSLVRFIAQHNRDSVWQFFSLCLMSILPLFDSLKEKSVPKNPRSPSRGNGTGTNSWNTPDASESKRRRRKNSSWRISHARRRGTRECVLSVGWGHQGEQKAIRCQRGRMMSLAPIVFPWKPSCLKSIRGRNPRILALGSRACLST